VKILKRFHYSRLCGRETANTKNMSMPTAAAADEEEERFIYGGFLTPASAATADAPLVFAEVLPRLIVVDQLAQAALSSSSSTFSHPALLQAPSQRNRRRPKQKRTANLTYYCCTKCGFSGSSCNMHRQKRPDCNSFPCTFRYNKEETSSKDASAAFLARCTPKQREMGLPPDYEQPVRLPGKDGRIDPSRVFLSVPMDRQAGDTFEVPTGRGLRTMVTVPEGRGPGDVLSIHAFTGLRPEQGAQDGGLDDDDDDDPGSDG
jgi:hypothetical protein